VLASACQEIQKNILSHIPAAGITDLRCGRRFSSRIDHRKTAFNTFITAYKVTRSFNMEKDADDGSRWTRVPGVPEAFEQRQAVFCRPVAAAPESLS